MRESKERSWPVKSFVKRPPNVAPELRTEQLVSVGSGGSPPLPGGGRRLPAGRVRERIPKLGGTADCSARPKRDGLGRAFLFDFNGNLEIYPVSVIKS